MRDDAIKIIVPVGSLGAGVRPDEIRYGVERGAHAIASEARNPAQHIKTSMAPTSPHARPPASAPSSTGQRQGRKRNGRPASRPFPNANARSGGQGPRSGLLALDGREHDGTGWRPAAQALSHSNLNEGNVVMQNTQESCAPNED